MSTLNDEQKAALRAKVSEWRKIAEPVGPLHALWDRISNAENLLSGRISLATYDELIVMDQS